MAKSSPGASRVHRLLRAGVSVSVSISGGEPTNIPPPQLHNMQAIHWDDPHQSWQGWYQNLCDYRVVTLLGTDCSSPLGTAEL